MDYHSVKTRAPADDRPSRREILRAAAAAACSLAFPRFAAAQETSQPVTLSANADLPWWVVDHPSRSTVIDVRSPNVVGAANVDPLMLDEMLARGVRDLTDASSPEEAWRMVLGDARTIALKFNSVGSPLINTTDVVARQLFKQIVDAGYDASGIMLIEAPEFLRTELGSRDVPVGWDDEIDVGDGREALARYLLEADAVINVPFLKTHQIAGMSGCLKNISHAVIRRPALYHANGCSPYVAQVIHSPKVRNKIRLNVMDALRVVVRNGPDAREEDLVICGGLLIGFDPLAVDQVGRSVLSVERRRMGIPPDVHVPYIEAAVKLGVGRAHPTEIKRVAVDLRT